MCHQYIEGIVTGVFMSSGRERLPKINIKESEFGAYRIMLNGHVFEWSLWQGFTDLIEKVENAKKKAPAINTGANHSTAVK